MKANVVYLLGTTYLLPSSSTRPSVATPRRNGSSTPYTSTASFVDWHQHRRSPVVWVRDTDFARQMVDPAVPPGRGATLFPSSANVKSIPGHGCILLELCACSIHLLGQLAIKAYFSVELFKSYGSNIINVWRNVLATIKNVCTFVASIDEIIESTIWIFFSTSYW